MIDWRAVRVSQLLLWLIPGPQVDIETASELCAGRTVVDLLNILGRTTPKNATVALTIDVSCAPWVGCMGWGWAEV